MPTDPVSTDDVRLSAIAAAQVAYHTRMAAVFGIAGESGESSSESVLAWVMLCSCWPDAGAQAQTTASELVGQNVARLSDAHRDRARRRAQSQALDLQAHFVSVGQHEEATLYARVAEDIDAAIASLVSH